MTSPETPNPHVRKISSRAGGISFNSWSLGETGRINMVEQCLAAPLSPSRSPCRTASRILRRVQANLLVQLRAPRRCSALLLTTEHIANCVSCRAWQRHRIGRLLRSESGSAAPGACGRDSRRGCGAGEVKGAPSWTQTGGLLPYTCRNNNVPRRRIEGIC